MERMNPPAKREGDRSHGRSRGSTEAQRPLQEPGTLVSEPCVPVSSRCWSLYPSPAKWLHVCFLSRGHACISISALQTSPYLWLAIREPVIAPGYRACWEGGGLCRGRQQETRVGVTTSCLPIGVCCGWVSSYLPHRRTKSGIGAMAALGL